MFKITEFHRVAGKTRMVIETDDSSSVMLFQFFGDIQKFIEAYFFRLRNASQIDLSQKERPARMEQAYAAYSRQLEQYRELPGTRADKLRTLKVLRASIGETVTLDRIAAELRVALELESNENIKKVKDLSEKGYSLQQISNELSLPKSTVSRYMKKDVPEPEKEVSLPPARVLPLRKARRKPSQ